MNAFQHKKLTFGACIKLIFGTIKENFGVFLFDFYIKLIYNEVFVSVNHSIVLYNQINMFVFCMILIVIRMIVFYVGMFDIDF